MSSRSTKFGTFKGVFTPSVLSILGVIMYLRLPWIVGEAGLLGVAGIILAAHFISIITGLSIASIATDKKVEKGGMYYMISRSLGLPIGGTLGLAFFFGLSFSISLYLIGFSEVFLTALGFEITKDLIRVTGTIALLIVTMLTFISTNLALKTQILILAIIVLSLVSILFGQHDTVPGHPASGFSTESLPWIALFAIFFPAVTGFGNGVSMSGDLRNPKRSIPAGTIGAIIVGLIVYLGLSFFLAYTVDRQVLKEDPAVLLNISLFAPVVIAGIWAATISSALGSILGAPRILQAIAIDKITPKFFAKSHGKGDEPRNALIMTFVIALVGILVGDLNVIARLVTIFFIITYGFLNLTCALENWAGSDFRPSFRIPVVISITGSIACFIVMIQLDFIAMIIATILLGGMFLFIKRKELHLQSGDTWGGFWSSMVKYGLKKLTTKVDIDKNNWRPNIILFSGGAKSRPHLIELASSMVGKMGVFTNFELIETPSEKVLFNKQAQSIVDTDSHGKTIFTRRHECSDVYQGMDLICRIYGFSGFEPNTILLGWSGRTKNPAKFVKALNNLIQLNYNISVLSFDRYAGFGQKKQIDLWWPGKGRELSFGLTLLKFITADPTWRAAQIRILVINYENNLTEKIHSLANQMLDNSRLPGNVKIINNSVEKIHEAEIIKNESKNTDLTILPVNDCELDEASPLEGLSKIVSQLKTTLIIRAGNEFDDINVFGDKQMEDIKEEIEKNITETPVIEKIDLPGKEILANEVLNISTRFQDSHTKFFKNGFGQISIRVGQYLNEFKDSPKKIFSQLEKIIESKETQHSKALLDKHINDYAFKAQNHLHKLNNEILPEIKEYLSNSINEYINDLEADIAGLPRRIIVNYNHNEFSINKEDLATIKYFKLRKKFIAWILRRPVKQKTELKKAVRLFLFNRRLEMIDTANSDFRIHSYKMVTKLKDHFSNVIESFEKIKKSIDNGPDETQKLINTERKKLAKEQEVINKDTKNAFEHISKMLYSDLRINLQKTSYILDNPAGKFRLKLYERSLKKSYSDIQKLEEMPEIWFNNMRLFVNKSNLEFLLITFKKRIKTKLNKKFSDLQVIVETNMLQNLRELKEQVNSFNNTKKKKDPDSLRHLFNKETPFELNEYFKHFFNEMHEIVQKLPEKTIINDEHFVQQIEKGVFALSETKTINVRQNVEFYIGTELINNARLELDNVTAKLNRASHNIHDIIRLTLFNLENIPKETDDAGPGEIKEETDTLLGGLLERIETEEKQIYQLIEQTSANLNNYLESAFENINTVSLTKKAEPTKSKKPQEKENPIKRFVKKKTSHIISLYKNQMVRALYTKSESAMIAQKLTAFEKQHKISNQSIHEILENYKPEKEIIKDIPYYYMSIFSVSSIINKDLWIGMKKQLQEAEKAFTRFNNGYPGGLLITGDRNSGKSSLSKVIANTITQGFQEHFIKAPKGEIPDDEAFYGGLKASFNIENNIMDYFSAQSEKKVIIIDDLELWWHRAENGEKYLNEILEMINRFGNKFFFIITCKTYAYNFLNALYDIDGYFLGHARCEPLDARELKDMIMLRHKAGGLKFNHNNKSEDDFSEWDYAKLFNKYYELTNGNPGQTTKAWINNIINISGRVIEIQSPKKPNTQYGLDISDELWVIVLQFILHRRLSVKKLSAILHQPENTIHSLMQNMLRAGIVEKRFEDIFALNQYLEPVFVKNLKKKNML